MTDTIIRYANGHIVTPGGTWPGATITVDADGRIAGIAPLPRDAGGGAIDLAGGWIMPGFIDTQVNGGGGISARRQRKGRVRLTTEKGGGGGVLTVWLPLPST